MKSAVEESYHKACEDCVYKWEKVLRQKWCCLAFRPPEKTLCLAATNTQTHHLHCEARRWQRRAVRCFSADGPGRLAELHGEINATKCRKIQEDNLIESATID